MKCLAVSLAVLIVVASLNVVRVDGQCPEVCTFEYRPVCGFSFNGACFRQFGNQCAFNVEQCRSGNLWQVNLYYCQLASSGRDRRVRSCQ